MQGATQIVQGFGKGRILRHRSFELADSLFRPSLGDHDEAKIAMGLGITGAQGQRPFQGLGGFIQPPQVAQHIAAIVMGLGQAGVQA